MERARIVLRAAAGLQDQQIALELGITPEKAARWRNRYLDGGIEALEKDAVRPGRPRTITETRAAAVIQKTTQEKPFNATHWSTRTMAAATGLSETSVRRSRVFFSSAHPFQLQILSNGLTHVRKSKN